MQDARPCRGPSAIRWFAISAICILTAAPFPARASGPPSLPEMLEDAELCDIRFVDSSQGWAVGDRGVIWHTQDGGQSWQLQDSPVSCRLESICFLDARRGWIVGGWVHPYTHASTGVVLRTEDGGRRWTADSNLTLPALKVVRFLDARRGWAVGHRSAMHRTGVFRTEDGGRSWAAVPGGNSQGWLAGDFRDDRSGAVAGRTGQLSLVAYSQLKPSPGPDLGLRHLHRLRLQGPAGGWLVGDGGLVQQTSDGGLTWQAPPGPLPPGMATEFDFQALEVQGPHCWVAGSPGTRVFHSPDGGQRWEALATGQPLPINALCFADPQLGWACGPLGTILATRDGGRTWSRQRTGGTRVALLGIFSEAERVPLELLAGTSGEDGYLGWVELLTRRDLEIPLDAASPPEERAHRAAVSVGASGARSAWRFPLRQQGVGWSAEKIVAAWDLFADGQGTHLLEQHIVRRIRQWRPDVVVTETMSPHGNRPLAHLTNQLVLSAVQKAGDPTAFSDQLTLGSLRPWTVQKVFSHARDDETAAVTINPSQLAPRLGQSLADQATHGSSLLRSAYQPTASSHGFRLLLNRLPQDVGRQGIFHGLSLQPGGEARRLATPMPAVNLAELSRRAQRRRNVHQLIDRTQVGSADAAWLSQLDDLTHGLGGASGGEILYQLAERYRQSGKPALAADAFERLLAQYPDHPLVEPALLWLVQFYASQEAGWQLRRANRASTQHLAVHARLQPAVRGEVRPASFEEPLGQPAPPAVPAAVAGRATTVEPVAGGSAEADRATRAVELGKLIERTRPALLAEPAVRFPLAAAYRATGLPRDAERLYQTLAGQAAGDDWSRCADAELWLGQVRGAPPKKVWTCAAAPGKPRLDGRLDDELWQRVRPQPLASSQHDDAEWPANVLLAYDAEYLYLAVSCRKAPGRNYASQPATRDWDTDLTDRDRVELWLDVDRDYATWYRLTVDHRGWTGEACLGDVSWNPQWFVAAAEDETLWTVEAAIDWSQLTSTPPRSRTAWAAGAVRVVPGLGVQAFTGPAAIAPRASGFGLLIFE